MKAYWAEVEKNKNILDEIEKYIYFRPLFAIAGKTLGNVQNIVCSGNNLPDIR